MDLTNIIMKTLKDYTDEVVEHIDEVGSTVGKQAVSQLKVNSPRRSGSHGGTYSKSWRIKKEKGKYIVHSNKPSYRLTHLLEKGHALRNGGRAKAIPHIKPVEEFVQQEVERQLKKRLKG